MPARSSRPHRRAGRPRAVRAAGAVLATALAAGLATGLVACSSDPVADQYRSGDNKGYIGSDGLRVDEIKAADRTKPVAFGGTLETGKTFSSSETAGQVVVVNYGAWVECDHNGGIGVGVGVGRVQAKVDWIVVERFVGG